MTFALLAIFGYSAAAVLGGWLYFRRYAIPRPPLGVFNLRDVALMLGAIVSVPYLYLALPGWVVAALLGLSLLAVLNLLLEPVLSRRRWVWLALLLTVAVEIATAQRYGTGSTAFFAVNNLVQVLAVVGATNLWAQSGMKARDVTILAVALTLYDFAATSLFTVMGDLVMRLVALPFAPLVSWRVGEAWATIGLGDLLLATLFPLVMRKAFGQRAGLTALGVSLAALGGLLACFASGLLRELFPVMVILGPLMALQYVFWRQRRPERATWQFLQAEANQPALV